MSRSARRSGRSDAASATAEGGGDTPVHLRTTLRTLWPYLLEFPGRVTVAMGLLVAAKLSGVALPLILKRLVDHLAPGVAASLVTVPLTLLAAYGLLRFANVLFGELRDISFGRVSERAQRRAALRVFEHLHRLDLDFHLSRRTGGLAREIERGINGISFVLRFAIFNIVPTLLELLLVAVILWRNYDWRFALIALFAVLLYGGFSVLVTEWRTRFVREANTLDARANTRAIDSLLNYETVKYFGNEAYESGRYDDSLARWEQASARNRRSLSLLNSGQSLIVAASLTAMMWLAAVRVTTGALTTGDFVAINAFMMQLFIPLGVLGFVYREIRRAMTDMQKMFALLAEQPKIHDAAETITLPHAPCTLRFEHIGFAYHAKRTILHDVDFEIPAGGKLAVVGASGAGKSTIARLLFRFYDPAHGSIRINGVDLRRLPLDNLRSLIGVVPQDTVLFNDTIAYNIAYGRPDAGRADIEEAARLAHLAPFIAQLPDGYETMVGERGLKLSGGEKQRIAIARALLKDPPILILDEATASLDSASEQAILGALKQASRARTTLAIAHRLSTITDADLIVVLERGHIVERGTHAELLAAGGRYRELWALQQHERDTALAD